MGLRIEWVTVCEEVITGPDGGVVLVNPGIQGTLAGHGQRVTLDVAVVLVGDYEALELPEGHSVRCVVHGPEAVPVIDDTADMTVMRTSTAVEGWEARAVTKVRVSFDVLSHGVYTIGISVDDGPLRTVSHVVLPDDD